MTLKPLKIALVVFFALIACPIAIADPQETLESTLEYIHPEEFSLNDLLQTELKGADSRVICILKKADRLIRRHVGYRHDHYYQRFTREDLYKIHHQVRQLSCSEFVWYVYSICGLNMGYKHVETKDMAYHHNIYPKALVRVEDGSIQPGDILVYDFPLLEIAMEKQRLGELLSGHVVIVVSTEKMMIVGSHGHGSTPPGLPTGVGYRKLLKGWNEWTEGRKLRAVYRIKVK